MHRSTKTKRKQSIKSMQNIEACKTCMGRARAGMPMSAKLRPGVAIPEKSLHTHVRAECTAAGANSRYRMVASADVDDSM